MAVSGGGPPVGAGSGVSHSARVSAPHPSWPGLCCTPKAGSGLRAVGAEGEFAQTPAFGAQRSLLEARRRDPDCGSPFGIRVTSPREVSESPLRDLWVLSFGEVKVRCLAAGRLPASKTTKH